MVLPDLRRRAASQVAACLDGVAVGAALPIDSASDLCDTLEFVIPKILRREHSEWERESIDGFFFSLAVKYDERAAELAGTCILISDQTVTPFALDMRLSDTETFESLRILLGEPGQGPLGISGPACTSVAARTMLAGLNRRLHEVDWAYDLGV